MPLTHVNFFSLFFFHLVLTKIDNYTLLDYSLISSPEITENYLDLNLKVTLSSSEPSSWLSTASFQGINIMCRRKYNYVLFK